MGGGDAVTTLEVILRGKVLRGSSTNRNHKVFNLSLRSTAQESERDYKQNERWSEKEAQMVAEMCECSSLGCHYYYVSTINSRIEIMAPAHFSFSNTTA